MHFDKLAIALMTGDVAVSRDFYVEHLGFKAVVDLGWYASLHHQSHPEYVVDLMSRDHESIPEQFRNRSVDGVSIALVVQDAAHEESRLRADGVEIAEPLTDMPWGQRRFHLTAPEGTLVEVVQFTEPDPEWVAAQDGAA